MRLITAVLLGISSILFGTSVAEADKRVPRVIVGELQPGPHDVDPPESLDIAMWQGTLNGVDIGTRCANMGGHIGGEYLNWLGRWGYVCYHVDY